jgi:hypothetical protein
MYNFNYEKRKNKDLFNNLIHLDVLNNAQNFIPIYGNFFDINEKNYNSFNLNHKYYISDIIEKTEHNNIIIGNIGKINELSKIESRHTLNLEETDKDSNIYNNDKKHIFIKMAPLLDPFKFLTGKYELNDIIYNLPSYSSYSSNVTNSSGVTNIDTNVHPKILDVNNSAYVDSFFSFLSSILLNNYGVINGLDFYGSFLGIKPNFKINIIDDLDYLISSNFFNKNKNKLFKVDEYSHLLDDEDKLPPIKISDNISNKAISFKSIKDDTFDNVFDISNENLDINSEPKNSLEISSLEELQPFEISNTIVENDSIDINYNKNIVSSYSSKVDSRSTNSSFSSCSSRSSYTNSDKSNSSKNKKDKKNKNNSDSKSFYKLDDKEYQSESNNDLNLNSESDNDSDYDSYSGSESDSNIDSNNSESDYEDVVNVEFEKFPVQMICMENCENTLDNLLNEEDLTDDDWYSILMQVIMTLLIYQKSFSFTHNDLHTNNIMYNTTDKKYIYYCYKKKYYKVPTLGRIIKIIDFGRSIYKFNGKIFCSNSFDKDGDASTQYNCEPYFNEKKPRIEPNFSFDLSRLASSLFDYLIPNMKVHKKIIKQSKVANIISEWVTDDNGINILYKNNGDERYPEFKLYKMIARHVHNHTPELQLLRPEFAAFEIKKSLLKKNSKVINIDELPTF